MEEIIQKDLSSAHLFGQPGEEVAAPEKVQDEVELSLGLEGVVQLHDERVLHLRKDVALHLGADPIPDWKREGKVHSF